MILVFNVLIFVDTYVAISTHCTRLHVKSGRAVKLLYCSLKLPLIK